MNTTVQIVSNKLRMYLDHVHHVDIVYSSNNAIRLASAALTAEAVRNKAGQTNNEEFKARIALLWEAIAIAKGQKSHSTRVVTKVAGQVNAEEEYWRAQNPCKN